MRSGKGDVAHGRHDSRRAEQFYQCVLKNRQQYSEKFTDDFELGRGAQRLSTLTQVFSIPKFISDGLDMGDIKQGQLGDCWFLSGLACLVRNHATERRQAATKRIIQPGCNRTKLAAAAGIYRFKFFSMGEFVDVFVDDRIVVDLAASCSDTAEWWAPLCEKAYAKFRGSFDNIDGGLPGWALTELTGGIAYNIDTRSVISEDYSKLFDWLDEVQEDSVISASNLQNGRNNDGISEGLVAFHAYSLLQVKKVTTRTGEQVKLVNLRNPWANTEWTGPWSDSSEEWRQVSEEQPRE